MVALVDDLLLAACGAAALGLLARCRCGSAVSTAGAPTGLNSKPKLRNAEKDRRATCTFADEIASAALAEWRLRRPADFEPRQTVLAAFLALRCGEARLKELFVVSFGVGTKFRGTEADTSAQSLRDLHAEVLARRALKRFLHQDLCRCLAGAHGELLSRVASDRFALREDTSLHLYTTSVPCGNAAWKRWAKGGSTCPKIDADTKTAWPKQLHPKMHLHVRLVLARNRLTALPTELGRLAKLQYLDAADNHLSSIPEAIIACPSLNELWLKGNPVERLQLQAMPGFAEFLERRKQRLDHKIGANVVGRVDLSVCGLD